MSRNRIDGVEQDFEELVGVLVAEQLCAQARFVFVLDPARLVG